MGQYHHRLLLFLSGRKIYESELNFIKEISKSGIDLLVEHNVIANGCYQGNVKGFGDSQGYYSSGFYDVSKYKRFLKDLDRHSSKYQAMLRAHVGLYCTKNKYYIQDQYYETYLQLVAS